jgi:hypothetical protein
MPWGPRASDPSPVQAEGDKLYVFGQYSGASGALSAFMPVYKDVTDAAEYNVVNAATKITVGTTIAQPNTLAGSSNANQVNTAGKVTLGNTPFSGGVSAGSVPAFVGIYNPETLGTRPSVGDIIRIQRWGSTPVAISAGFAPAVGDYINSGLNNAFAQTTGQNANQPSVGSYIGRVLATAAQISVGQTITPLPAFQVSGSGGLGGGTYYLINGYIDR